MNLTRLVVLGLLAERGPCHGHQLRLDVEVTEVERWGGVGAGSVHRELRAMATAGLVEPVRTEQVGRWPARTVYGITDRGRQELSSLREQAVMQSEGPPDALSVALVFAGAGSPHELAALLSQRQQALRAKAARLADERERGEAQGFLLPSVSPLQAASFRREEMRVANELAWHKEFETLLVAPATSTPARAKPAQGPSMPPAAAGRARS